jgi:glucose-fructose oxidoreductase
MTPQSSSTVKAKAQKKNTRQARSTKKRSAKKTKDKIRYAVVGLGHIAQAAVLPAFKHAGENSELAALVSDNQQKLQELGAMYKLDACYSYDQLEDCIERENIDAVYIALPNSLHRQFMLRSADTGAHVLCEKPLGVSAQECRDMNRAARQNRVYLMTAYRLHFDEANMHVAALVRQGKIGEPKIFSSVFSYQVAPKNIRLDTAERGGGPLFDLGVYCINAARYLFRSEPVYVVSRTADFGSGRFERVSGTCAALLIFPEDRVAQFTCSFAAGDSSYFELTGTKGKLCLEGAYEYSEGSELFLDIGGKSSRKKFRHHDQFSAELIYFSNCILKGNQPEPLAREAVKDLEVIDAIEQSQRSGRAVSLRIDEDKSYPSEKQVIMRPPISYQPRLVDVAPPHTNGADR